MEHKDTIKCPHCSSNEFVKNGSYKGKQRFKCKACNSTFFGTTNTAIHYVNDTEKWKKFIALLLTKVPPPSLTTLSKTLKISTRTAHHWKHKFLSSLVETNTLNFENNHLYIDLIYIPFWTKGKKSAYLSDKELQSEKNHRYENKYACFICIKDQNDDFDFYPIDIETENRPNKKVIYEWLQKLEIPKSGTIIELPKSSLLINYFEQNNYRNIVIKDILDLPEIKSINNDFQQWIKPFNGYSTKYIWNYLKWFKMIKLLEKETDVEKIIGLALEDSRGWLRFMMIRHYYREFIMSK